MIALLLVDLQNDFMPGGALAVPSGDEVVAVANRLMPQYGFTVATQDWHPAGHGSFASSHAGKTPGEHVDLDGVDQVLWPDHCVQDTPGARFHSALDVARIGAVVRKGTDPRIDSYSGFFDNARRKRTALEAQLRERAVDEVDVIGLATDYCVLFTVLDALDLGLRVRLIEEGCRGIDLAPGDVARAIGRMREAGAVIN